MATSDGRDRDSVNRELFQTPYRFDFFQAVRVLEYRERERARGRRDHPPESRGIGHDNPAREIVRFRALPSLGFPASTISEIHEAAPRPGAPSGEPLPPEMVVTFMGITGPSGVLPRHYTELLIQRIRDKDYSLRDFLDLFNHRLISLFYRAWEKYHWPVAYERSQLDAPGREPDLATWGLYCAVGMGTTGLRGRLEVDDEVFLYYSGHFAHFPRSALGLESMLADHLEMPVQVLQCQGQWLELATEDQALMPSPRQPLGRNNQLGVNLVVGERVWDIQSKFRLRVGPLTWRQFRSLMPDGKALRPLCQITRTYVGPTLDFDIQPVLKREEVPPCQLTTNSYSGPYLGWNTWIPGETISGEVDDAIFSLDTI